MEKTNKMTEVNKLIYRMMKAQNPEDEDAFGLVCLMANHMMTRNQVEKKVNLEVLCDKYDVDYYLVIGKERPNNTNHKINRCKFLICRNIETNFITTRRGKHVPDLRLFDFEKKYKKELSYIEQNYQEIQAFIYCDGFGNEEVDNNISSIIEKYFDPSILVDIKIKFIAIKAIFRAIRRGEIQYLQNTS